MKRANRIQKIKKQKNLFRLLIIILFFSVLSIATMFLSDRQSNAMKESLTSSKIYPGLNLKTRKQETDIYTLFISQAVSEVDEINKPINDWINQERENFKKEVQSYEEVLKKHDLRAQLNIETNTDKLAENLYNLELESYQISGGANGTTKVETFLIDLNENKFLENKDIFSDEESSLDAIRELFFEEIMSDKDRSNYIFENMLEERMADEDSWKLSVHTNSIDFIFDQYDVAAGAAGNIRVSLPMNQLSDHLNPDFAEKLDLEQTEKEESPEKIVNEDKASKKESEKLKAGGKYIALTFDDGPHQKVTPRILEILDKHQAKATFYMLGNQVDYYPSIAKEVFDEGHELASHTKSHKDLTQLGTEQIREEIESTSQSIKEATGEYPQSLRPPYGAYNDAVKNLANELNLPIVMWSVDSLDWKNRDTQAINQEVMSSVHPGAIILLHDIHSTTADALDQLLNNLENEGYEFVKVSQLLDLAEEDGVGPYYNVKLSE